MKPVSQNEYDFNDKNHEMSFYIPINLCDVPQLCTTIHFLLIHFLGGSVNNLRGKHKLYIFFWLVEIYLKDLVWFIFIGIQIVQLICILQRLLHVSLAFD